MLYDFMQVNPEGQLCIEGLTATALAEQYGTPLYVLDEDVIRRNCRTFQQAVADYCPGSQVFYASKAFSCKAMLRTVYEEGLGIDVVSGGELVTAKEAGIPMDRVCLHGNYKTEQELQKALSYGVGRIVVDSREELLTLSGLAVSLSRQAHILLRVKPGVEAHTHEAMLTGTTDCKFGFCLEGDEAFEMALLALSLPGIRLVGLHCHIGSQIFESGPFAIAADRMTGLMGKIAQQTGYACEELDLGGGFGVRYLPQDDPLPYGEYIKLAAQTVKEQCDRLGLTMPTLCFEPGRAIVAEAGVALYRVGSVKCIPGGHTYVTVDGSMADNPRYALYGSAYTMLVANRADQPKDTTVVVAGRCCESGDLLGKDVALQHAEQGDLLAVLCAGAYQFSMASHYNRLPNPAVVAVKDGVSKLWVRREQYEDLLTHDMD